MIQKLTGIVIRETKINEADKMLTVLTAELGPVSVLAKNIRKSKSKISSSAAFLCYSDFVLSGGPDVYYINQCSLIESFYDISNDIQKLALASYLGHITADLSPVGEPQPEAVKLFLNTLYVLAHSDKNIFMIKSVFELRLMKCLGYMPDVFSCSKCGRELYPFYFDIKNANVLCAKCGVTSYPVSKPVMNALRYILTCEEKKIFSFEMDDILFRQLADITKAYIINIMGFKPKTLEYFETII